MEGQNFKGIMHEANLKFSVTTGGKFEPKGLQWAGWVRLISGTTESNFHTVSPFSNQPCTVGDQTSYYRGEACISMIFILSWDLI